MRAFWNSFRISANTAGGKQKKVSDLSDGNKMKLMLAGVLARETSLLILDEPASPLDPLMRDILCDILRQYLDQGRENGRSFSPPTISRIWRM